MIILFFKKKLEPRN